MEPAVLAAYLATITLVLLPPDGNAILVAGAYAARGWRGALAFAAGDLTANLAQMTLGATAVAAVVATVPHPLLPQLLTLGAGWVIVDGTLLLAYGGLGGSLLTRLVRSRPGVLGYANALGLLFAAAVVALIAPPT